MESAHQNQLDTFMEGLKKRNEGQPEFHQAVYEVAATIIPYIADKDFYKDAQILERLTAVTDYQGVIKNIPWHY